MLLMQFVNVLYVFETSGMDGTVMRVMPLCADVAQAYVLIMAFIICLCIL